VLNQGAAEDPCNAGVQRGFRRGIAKVQIDESPGTQTLRRDRLFPALRRASPLLCGGILVADIAGLSLDPRWSLHLAGIIRWPHLGAGSPHFDSTAVLR